MTAPVVWDVFIGETRAIEWDFASELPVGVTISNPAVDIEERTSAGVVSATGFTVSGETIAETTKVQALVAIADTVEEGDYGVEIQVDGSDGQVFHGARGGRQPILQVRAL